ncbi:MAG: AAA family ATPase [Lachnospiraceae bacterium]|nr:AAA family ATPase [Lachnospiraceae bacterium]
MTPNDRRYFESVQDVMSESVATISLQRLCGWLERYYHRKCIVLLDEYDTPMQEVFVHGYWKELTAFIRKFLNNTFKSNQALGRGIMTGITRVSKESVFSDLNNLNVITTTTDEYAASFGFTEEEVFAAMDEVELPGAEKAEVNQWYDDFRFGKVKDIYNPWSIINYLDKRKSASMEGGDGLLGQLTICRIPPIIQ